MALSYNSTYCRLRTFLSYLFHCSYRRVPVRLLLIVNHFLNFDRPKVTATLLCLKTCFCSKLPFLLFCFYFVQSEEIEVVSSFGQIRGLKVKINNGTDSVYQFRNIPYAVPPVGKLRFQKPLPHGPLSGVYDATEFGPTCVQRPNGYFKVIFTS